MLPHEGFQSWIYKLIIRILIWELECQVGKFKSTVILHLCCIMITSYWTCVAIKLNKYHMANVLCSWYVTNTALSVQDTLGKSLLSACQTGDMKSAKLYVLKGADIMTVDAKVSYINCLSLYDKMCLYHQTTLVCTVLLCSFCVTHIYIHTFYDSTLHASVCALRFTLFWTLQGLRTIPHTATGK
jgi:hypothetical protein